MIDWITGEKFVSIADLVFYPENVSDCNPLKNTFCPCALKEVNIVYTHTMYVRQLFERINGLKCNFIIVTHNCDQNVDSSYEIPGNVIRWFSQNVNIVHPKIESIPIGLENDKWFRAVNKKNKMMAKLKEKHKIKNLAYLNINVNTNPAERVPVLQLFKDKSWVTVRTGVNGRQFDDYLDNIYNHCFVLSPMGNGIDTHRTWEALYMSSIPIEKRNNNNRFYTDLPICFVDDWTDITREFLEREYIRIRTAQWNLKKLTFTYWKDKILCND